MGAPQGIQKWLDERLARNVSAPAPADRTVAGGPRWSYVTRWVLVVLLLFQVLSGFLLSLSYSPGVDSSHASLTYILEETTLGWFLHSLHHRCPEFIVVFIAIHIIQSLVYGAYKKPKELTWVIGGVIAFLMMAFMITGHLLPWDQLSYWATVARVSIFGSAPIIGPSIENLVQGGPEIGNLTLTRFYTAHIFLLPMITLVLLAFHVHLARKHGVTPPPGTPDDAPAAPLNPTQLSRTLIASFVVIAALFALAAWDPPRHGEVANPSVNYPARPEWFFFFIYQFFKYLEGPMEGFGSMVLFPGVLTFGILLPFFDRGKERRLWKRKFALVVGLGYFISWGALTGAGYYADYKSGFFEELAIWHSEAEPNFLVEEMDLDAYYKKECKECHGRKGAGYLDTTPDFDSEVYWTSVQTDVRLIKAILYGVPDETIPEDERMPAYKDKLTPEEARAMVEIKLRGFYEPEE